MFSRFISNFRGKFCEHYVSFISHWKNHILRPKTIMENHCHINTYSPYFENAVVLAKNSHNQINGAKKVSTSFWYKKEPWTWARAANDSMWNFFFESSLVYRFRILEFHILFSFILRNGAINCIYLQNLLTFPTGYNLLTL